MLNRAVNAVTAGSNPHVRPKLMRVLIAEDNPDLRQMLGAVLHRAGHKTVEVENGRQALEAIDADPNFDVMLIDWMMPGVNGVSVVERVRARTDGAQDAFIVMITALDDPERIKEAMLVNVDDFLIKPFSLDIFELKLKTAEKFATLIQQVKAGATVCTLRLGDEEKFGTSLASE